MVTAVGLVELGTLHSLELRGRVWPHFKHRVPFAAGVVTVCHDLATDRLRLAGSVRDMARVLRPGNEVSGICYRAADNRWGPDTKGLVVGHVFGEEGGRLPRLEYSAETGELALEGGDYRVGPEGIRN